MKKHISNSRFKKSKWSLKKPLFLKKTDDRYPSHLRQLEERGFSDSETWCLFATIAEFVLPRLQSFKDITICHPASMTEKEWKKRLDKMIFAFQWALADAEGTKAYYRATEDAEEQSKNWKKYEEGMKIFCEDFMGLWW
jgi:hypothetical protein